MTEILHEAWSIRWGIGISVSVGFLCIGLAIFLSKRGLR